MLLLEASLPLAGWMIEAADISLSLQGKAQPVRSLLIAIYHIESINDMKRRMKCQGKLWLPRSLRPIIQGPRYAS